MQTRDALFDKVFGLLASWAGLRVVEGLLREHDGVACFVAGGVVRDLLLDLKPSLKDVDLFLNGTGVDGFLDELRDYGEVGTGPFGSPRWMPQGAHCYADVIVIPRFDNGLWPCEDMIDALNQFDFTCNAVALNLRTREVFDPQNGTRDAARRIMRAVRFDYPREPIAPGSELLRPTVLWFRILHYAAAKHLTIEPVTLSWLRSQLEYLEFETVFAKTFFPLHQHAFAPLEDARR